MIENKEKIIKIVGVLFIIVLNIFLNLIVYRKINNRFIITSILSIVLTIFLLAIIKYSKIKNRSFEKKFILCFFSLGLVYLFSFPIGALPDEVNHFMRAYEISKGHLVSDKYIREDGTTFGATDITDEIENVMVKSIHNYQQTFDNLKIKNNKKGKTKPYDLTNISMYSFICYMPQAIGISLSRILNLPIVCWGYLARICNFIIFSMLLYYSLKHLPFKKISLVFIALLPITIQLGISLSADSLTIATSFALLATVLNIKYTQKERLSKRQILWLGFLSIVMSLCKIVYLPICLLICIIPTDKFKNRKQKWLVITSILLLVVLANLIWLAIASDFLLTIEGRTNPDLQLELILKNPFRYMGVILNTISLYLNKYIVELLGHSLGRFDITLSDIYIFINLIILIILVLCDNKNIKIDRSMRILSLFIFLSITLLTFTSLYLDWTEVYSFTIEGVQGRYFIPIILYLLISLSSNSFNMKIKEENKYNYLLLFMIFENIYAIMRIMCTY